MRENERERMLETESQLPPVHETVLLLAACPSEPCTDHSGERVIWTHAEDEKQMPVTILGKVNDTTMYL